VLFEQSAQNAVKITQQLKDMIDIWEKSEGRVGSSMTWNIREMRLLIKFLNNCTVP